MRHFLADWKRWSRAERVAAIVLFAGAILAPAAALAGV